MVNDLVARLDHEFDRHVPEEYAELIKLALGNPDETDFLTKRSLFFPIYEPHAFFLQDWLEKDARLGLAAAGLAEINAQDNNLTEFGHSFKAVVRDRDFIDLGCGIPCQQNPAPKYVSAFGGYRYIGVDMNLTPEQIERHSNVRNQFQEIYVTDEMLRFLSKIPASGTREKGLVLFFSAIESNFDYNAYLRISRKKRKTASDAEFLEERRLQADYHRALYSEIRRITGTGDAVIFGRRTNKMFPDYLLSRGFKRDPSSHACSYYRRI